MSRSGYYNASEIGYAMALLARHRQDPGPRSFKSMRLDSRDAVKKAPRYFVECDNQQRSLLFDANRIPSAKSNPSELAAWFAGDDECFALAAGYAFSNEVALRRWLQQPRFRSLGDRIRLWFRSRLSCSGDHDRLQSKLND